MSQTALWFFFGVLILFSVLGNAYAYIAIATEEARPDARRAYYVVNAAWSIFNVLLVGAILWRCFR